MVKNLVHTLIMGADSNPPPYFTNPFSYVPHPFCVKAAKCVRDEVLSHPEWKEELNRGKMFGVLVIKKSGINHETQVRLSQLYNYGIDFCEQDLTQTENAGEDVSNVFTPSLSENRNATWTSGEKNTCSDNTKEKTKRRGDETIANGNGEFGFLMAFSGQMNGESVVDGFVPPIFDVNTSEYFRSEMHEIESMMDRPKERKQRSENLQDWLFKQYICINVRGEEKSIMDIFTDYYRKKMLKQDNFNRNATSHHIPSGTGECCAPKLLNYAFYHGLKPLCMAEFWIQTTPKEWKSNHYKDIIVSEIRHDRHFYPACNNKCRPILDFMLDGIDIEKSIAEHRDEELLDKVKIVYEDQHIIVVDKPSGLLSVPGRNTSMKSMADWLRDYHKTEIFWFVHRLDQDTSGLLIISKDESTYKDLQQQFIRHEVKKTYEALLDGVVAEDRGIIKLRMRPDLSDSPRQIVDMEHGKQAVTRWKVLKRMDNKTIIELYPDTGRTHQLRVHCAHPQGLNAPIHGDRLYGNGVLDSQLCLRAKRIEFMNNGERMLFEVE